MVFCYFALRIVNFYNAHDMKKTLLSFVLMALGYSGLVGQNALTIEPAEAFGNGPVTSTDIGAHATVRNTSTDTLRLLWTRDVQSSTQGWTSWICDLNNCYLPHIAVCPTSRPNVLAPGDTIDFQVHINPSGTAGSATICVTLYDMDNPDEILGTVKAMLETSTTSVTDVTKNDLQLFPNPTTSYFEISNATNVSHVVIHALVGTKVREFNAKINGSRFDVSDLPQGIYLVRLMDDTRSVLKTMRLSKR
jgi:hypothetical protein